MVFSKAKGTKKCTFYGFYLHLFKKPNSRLTFISLDDCTVVAVVVAFVTVPVDWDIVLFNELFDDTSVSSVRSVRIELFVVSE